MTAAIVSLIGGLLFRHQLYSEQLEHEANTVAAALTPLAAEAAPLRTGVNVSLENGWLLLTDGGALRTWSPDLDPFLARPGELGADPDVTALQPGLQPLRNRPYTPNVIFHHALTLGPAREGQVSPLTARTVKVICASYAFTPGSGERFEFPRPGDRGTFCKMVLPWRADQAAAAVGSWIAIGVLMSALLVGGIAWLVTGMALRPVRAINRQLAHISDLRLDQRVPVPTTRDAISELARTVNLTLDRLQIAAAQQRRFIADASHELRSPITALGSALEVALAYPDQADWRQVIVDASAETSRLQALTEDLLTLARLEQPATAPARTVDLAALVCEVATERRTSRPDSTRLVAEPREPMMVRAHPTMLERMLRNLFDNAERHAATTVWADVYRDGHHAVVLTVTNDGPPIPIADRENIFRPFTRLDHARSRDTGGTGLGLAIVREIVLLHGGNVRVADTATDTTFEVTLPALEE